MYINNSGHMTKMAAMPIYAQKALEDLTGNLRVFKIEKLSSSLREDGRSAIETSG